MERIYNKFTFVFGSMLVLALNLSFPKPSIEMITINLITMGLLLHGSYWFGKHFDELRFLRNLKYDLVRAAFYHETGQVTYRMELKGRGEYYFVYDPQAKVYAGFNSPLKHRKFLYPRMAKVIRDFGLPIPNMDIQDGHNYTRRNHCLTCFDSIEKEQGCHFFKKNERFREEKEAEGYNFIDNQKVVI